MNRPRKNGKHLPRRMVENHGAYYLLVPAGFRRNKHVRLGPVRAEGKTEQQCLADALKAYADRIAEADKPRGSMVTLVNDWQAKVMPKYAEKTRLEYKRMTDIVKDEFEEYDVDEVRPSIIATFLDGKFGDKPNMANKYKALLSLLFGFAVRRGLRDDNPCRDIRGMAEPKRWRYITDDELRRVRAAAMVGRDGEATESGPMIVCLIDLAVITGQRIGDLLALRRGDVRPEGIIFRPSKTSGSTGVTVPVKMTPQLRDVLARANSIAGGDDDGAQVKGLTVIHTTTGKPYTYAGAQTAWKRAIARAREAYEKECVEAGVQPVAGFLQNMHFHDLRRKSLTDAKAQGKDPQKLGGHTDPKMTARYLEQVEIEWLEPTQMANFAG